MDYGLNYNQTFLFLKYHYVCFERKATRLYCFHLYTNVQHRKVVFKFLILVEPIL